MANKVAALPPGFELDPPPAATATSLPPGFEIGPPEETSTLKDVALGGAQGLRNFGEGLVNLPSVVEGGLRWASGRGFSMPYDVNNLTRKVVPNYDPKTTPGAIAKNVMEYAPAFIEGPGAGVSGVARMGAKALAKGAASAAGAKVGGTVGGVPGAMIGAMVAPGAVEGVIARSAKRAAMRAAPKTADLYNAADKGYDAFRKSGVIVNSKPFSKFATQQLGKLDEMALGEGGLGGGGLGGMNPQDTLAPKTNQLLYQMRDMPPDRNLNAGQLDFIRKKLGKIAKQTLDHKPTEDAAAATAVLQDYIPFLERFPKEATISGDFQSALKTLKEANKNYAQASKAREIEDIGEKAKLGAASENSGYNTGNKLKKAYANFLGAKRSRGLTAKERAAVQALVKGSFAKNAVRSVGNTLGGGGGIGGLVAGRLGAEMGGAGGASLGMAAGGLAGAGAGLPSGMLATMAVGRGSRALYNHSVMGEAERLAHLMRSSSPLARATPMPPPYQRPPLEWLRRMIAAQQAAAHR